MDRLAIVYDEAMVDHLPGTGHPDRPERLTAIADALSAAPLRGVSWRGPRDIPDEVLYALHPRPWVEQLRALDGREGWLDADTPYTAGSIRAAWRAAGSAIAAVDALLDGESQSAFALVRPPGHHAEASRAMGFCVLNNVAIAAQHARARGCERVLVVDWDVHHGNGTQALFASRRDVLFFSAHQFPFYPGTGALDEVGEGDARGFTVNAPLPSGATDGDVHAVFQGLLTPIADRFRPDLVLVSAGFDAHRDDPLGEQRLTDEGFASLCAEVQAIAQRHAGGRCALLLEGGYNPGALAASALACAEVLCGATPPPAPSPGRDGARVARAGRALHAATWSGLDRDDGP